MGDEYFKVRLQRDPAESEVWRAIVEDLQKKFMQELPQNSLDLGCGYGDFSRHLRAHRKTAIDLGSMQEFQAPEVHFIQGDIFELLPLQKMPFDLIFASNLIEHLERDPAQHLLKQLHQQMLRGGKLILIQPNFRFCYRRYFDDYTHRTIYTDESLKGLLKASGFVITHCKERYLPFSMRGNILPKSYFLTKTYLALGSPILGAQMLIVAEKN